MMHQLYRACLIAYPRDFRAAYGDELTSVIRSRCRQERDRFGLWRSLTYASGAFLDLVATGLRIRLRSWRAGSRRRHGLAIWYGRGAESAQLGSTDSAAGNAGAPARPSLHGHGPVAGRGASGERGLAGVLDRTAQDLRHAIRALLQRPLFTTVAVATLALGIGANTLIFSVAHAVLVNPLPYSEPERLMGVYRRDPRVTGSDPSASRLARIYAVPYEVFLDWRELSPVFADIGAYAETSLTLTGQDDPERLMGVLTTSGVFSTLGAQPLFGRPFLPEDDEVGAPSVTVLSHGLWQRRFGADREIIGEQISLSGMQYTIVGVMPRDFYFPDSGQDLWVSFDDERKQNTYRAGGYLQVIARLKPAVTLDRARAEMDAVALRIAEVHPDEEEHGVILLPRMELVVADSRAALLIFVGAVGIVLLIACANIASLLLVRALERRKELAVRAALGAGRGRLVVQVLSESLVLSIAGGFAGALIALYGLEPFAATFPGGLPRASEIVVDYRVLMMATGFSLATGLLIGILPALRSARIPMGEALPSGDRGYTGSRSRNRTQAILVVAQVALAFALLVGAGLLMKSFLRLIAVEHGFEAENRVAMSIVLPEPYRSSFEETRLFFDELGERLSALPGVEVVGSASQLPFIGGSSWPPVLVETSEGEIEAGIHAVSATPAYFEAMGVPLRLGRSLSPQDREGSVPVIVINETMAQRYWPDENPIGRRISLEGYILDQDDVERIWLTVVGVVADFRYSHGTPPYTTYWFPFAQYPYFYQTLVIKTATDPSTVIAPARAALREIDPNIPSLIGRYDEIIDRAPGMTGPRFGAFATGLLAAIAALLALLGIYGVLASAVAQRTHEIGIRIALGACSGNLLRAVLRRGLLLTGLGLAVGLGVALLAARLLESVLYGISPRDPLTLAEAGILVLTAALAAGYLPARRATKIDPVEALRRE